MRTIELVSGIQSSALGFGCGPILGSVDSSTATRALRTAFDAGVTHIDIARSYGYGGAEAWLGRELIGRRDHVVLATKFGIVASPAARLFGPLKPLVRMIRKLRRKNGAAVAGKMTAGLGGHFHKRVRLDPSGLRQSVEKSLRELRTDRLEYLFLHDPQGPISDINEIEEMANILKKEGKIRAWGLAFVREKSGEHKSLFNRFDVLQFDLAPGAHGYEETQIDRAGNPNILFSPFRGACPDIPRMEILKKLGRDFPRSVILCSMFNPDHIRANARAF